MVTPAQLRRVATRLQEYLAYCFDGMGRLERRRALGNYLRGLLLDGERKSLEPVAARLVNCSGEVDAMRQRLQQAVVVARWDEGELYRRVAERFDASVEVADAFVIDDTGFAKKGKHSVGVQRQYSGTLGRVDNCQVATSLHLASPVGGACIGMQLYMPESWTQDEHRRRAAGVPDCVEFRTKIEISLHLLDRALGWGLRKRVVLADAGYGDNTDFREQLAARDLTYVVGINGTQLVWTGDEVCKPPVAGRGRSRWTYPGKPQSAKELMASLPAANWRKSTWGRGSLGPQSGRFAAVRIRTAHRYARGAAPGQEQWLLAEWPPSKAAPTKFWLASMPNSTPRKELVRLAKLRWRIERDYQEMKGELGLDHFEGRTWQGFQHHCACVAAAHAFLAIERARFPPEAADHHPALQVSTTGRSPSHAWTLPTLPPHGR